MPGPDGTPTVSPALPSPDASWSTFVGAVRAAQERCPPTFCPVKKAPRPWIDLDALGTYVPDPVRTVLEANEGLLWTVYLFYAVNGSVKPATSGALVKVRCRALLKYPPGRPIYPSPHRVLVPVSSFFSSLFPSLSRLSLSPSCPGLRTRPRTCRCFALRASTRSACCTRTTCGPSATSSASCPTPSTPSASTRCVPIYRPLSRPLSRP